jgi:hypothetical protein
LISNILKNILFSISFIIPTNHSDKHNKPYDRALKIS